MVTWIWVNIGSGNGLVPNSTKPLPKPMLVSDQWGPVEFTVSNFEASDLVTILYNVMPYGDIDLGKHWLR